MLLFALYAYYMLTLIYYLIYIYITWNNLYWQQLIEIQIHSNSCC